MSYMQRFRTWRSVMHRIALVVQPDFQMMSLAAISAFEFANVAAGRAVYEIRILSETGGPVPASLGPTIATAPFTGGLTPPEPTPGLLAFVRQSLESARRVAAICMGAFVLAEAGVLDGRRATTHWAAARELQARFPRITVEPDRIFIVDGSIWTSAGASAGIDLALGMIDRDL